MGMIPKASTQFGASRAGYSNMRYSNTSAQGQALENLSKSVGHVAQIVEQKAVKAEKAGMNKMAYERAASYEIDLLPRLDAEYKRSLAAGEPVNTKSIQAIHKDWQDTWTSNFEQREYAYMSKEDFGNSIAKQEAAQSISINSKNLSQFRAVEISNNAKKVDELGAEMTNSADYWGKAGKSSDWHLVKYNEVTSDDSTLNPKQWEERRIADGTELAKQSVTASIARGDFANAINFAGMDRATVETILKANGIEYKSKAGTIYTEDGEGRTKVIFDPKAQQHKKASHLRQFAGNAGIYDILSEAMKGIKKTMKEDTAAFDKRVSNTMEAVAQGQVVDPKVLKGLALQATTKNPNIKGAEQREGLLAASMAQGQRDFIMKSSNEEIMGMLNTVTKGFNSSTPEQLIALGITDPDILAQVTKKGGEVLGIGAKKAYLGMLHNIVKAKQEALGTLGIASFKMNVARDQKYIDLYKKFMSSANSKNKDIRKTAVTTYKQMQAEISKTAIDNNMKVNQSAMPKALLESKGFALKTALETNKGYKVAKEFDKMYKTFGSDSLIMADVLRGLTDAKKMGENVLPESLAFVLQNRYSHESINTFVKGLNSGERPSDKIIKSLNDNVAFAELKVGVQRSGSAEGISFKKAGVVNEVAAIMAQQLSMEGAASRGSDVAKRDNVVTKFWEEIQIYESIPFTDTFNDKIVNKVVNLLSQTMVADGGLTYDRKTLDMYTLQRGAPQVTEKNDRIEAIIKERTIPLDAVKISDQIQKGLGYDKAKIETQKVRALYENPEDNEWVPTTDGIVIRNAKNMNTLATIDPETFKAISQDGLNKIKLQREREEAVKKNNTKQNLENIFRDVYSKQSGVLQRGK